GPGAVPLPSRHPRPAGPPGPPARGTGPPARLATAAGSASGSKPRPPRRSRPCCRPASPGWAGAHGSQPLATTLTHRTLASLAPQALALQVAGRDRLGHHHAPGVDEQLAQLVLVEHRQPGPHPVVP